MRSPKVSSVVRALRKLYPKAHCELDFKTPLDLLVAVILSAQCTDVRVNKVTQVLFKRCHTPEDFATIETGELEGIIRSAGFFRSKAKSIQETARAILRDFKGRVPDTMEQLLTLRGVARKTANVILGTVFGLSEGIVVDTHMKRVSYRLGLTRQTDPVKVERDLMKVVPRKDWIFFGHAMVWHGRRLCHARSPNCPECPMRSFCPKRGV